MDEKDFANYKLWLKENLKSPLKNNSPSNVLQNSKNQKNDKQPQNIAFVPREKPQKLSVKVGNEYSRDINKPTNNHFKVYCTFVFFWK